MVFGSVMGPSSQRANECRIAMFLAGFPDTVPVHTVNRQCSSGLQVCVSVCVGGGEGGSPAGRCQTDWLVASSVGGPRPCWRRV